LKTNETELESRQLILRRSEEADATAATVSPNQEPKGVATPRRSSASFAGNRRAGGCGEAKFSYPQTLEKAQNRERISLSLLAPARAGVQGNAASDSSGFIPQDRPKAGGELAIRDRELLTYFWASP
jgi:hypothetical protein